MKEQEVATFLIEHSLMNEPQVSFVGRGEANKNYLAKAGDERLIVRTARQDVPVTPRFANERHFMLFVEAMNVSFAPRSIFYDESRQIHVISYAAGKDASVIDLNEAQQDVFVSQLQQLSTLTHDQYVAWCQQTEVTPIPVRTAAERIKANLTDRLAFITSKAADPLAATLVEWAAAKQERFEALVAKVLHNTLFYHGDLRWNEGGGNLRVQDGQITFIDWEGADFTNDGMNEVADVLGSIPLASIETAKSLYCKYIAEVEDVESINQAIEYGVLWGKLANPMWSAERYLQLRDNDESDVERYVTLTKQGMEDAEYYFERNFEDWF